MKFGLSSEQFYLLENILIHPLKKRGAKVWLFGSRARGDFKTFSDIDILFETDNDFESGFLSKLTENIQESNLIYKVDLVNINDMALSYKHHILKDRIEL